MKLYSSRDTPKKSKIQPFESFQQLTDSHADLIDVVDEKIGKLEGQLRKKLEAQEKYSFLEHQEISTRIGHVEDKMMDNFDKMTKAYLSLSSSRSSQPVFAEDVADLLSDRIDKLELALGIDEISLVDTKGRKTFFDYVEENYDDARMRIDKIENALKLLADEMNSGLRNLLDSDTRFLPQKRSSRPTSSSRLDSNPLRSQTAPLQHSSIDSNLPDSTEGTRQYLTFTNRIRGRLASDSANYKRLQRRRFSKTSKAISRDDFLRLQQEVHGLKENAQKQLVEISAKLYWQDEKIDRLCGSENENRASRVSGEASSAIEMPVGDGSEIEISLSPQRVKGSFSGMLSPSDNLDDLNAEATASESLSLRPPGGAINLTESSAVLGSTAEEMREVLLDLRTRLERLESESESARTTHHTHLAGTQTNGVNEGTAAPSALLNDELESRHSLSSSSAAAENKTISKTLRENKTILKTLPSAAPIVDSDAIGVTEVQETHLDPNADADVGEFEGEGHRTKSEWHGSSGDQVGRGQGAVSGFEDLLARTNLVQAIFERIDSTAAALTERNTDLNRINSTAATLTERIAQLESRQLSPVAAVSECTLDLDRIDSIAATLMERIAQLESRQLSPVAAVSERTSDLDRIDSIAATLTERITQLESQQLGTSRRELAHRAAVAVTTNATSLAASTAARGRVDQAAADMHAGALTTLLSGNYSSPSVEQLQIGLIRIEEQAEDSHRSLTALVGRLEALESSFRRIVATETNAPNSSGTELLPTSSSSAVSKGVERDLEDSLSQLEKRVQDLETTVQATGATVATVRNQLAVGSSAAATAVDLAAAAKQQSSNIHASQTQLASQLQSMTAEVKLLKSESKELSTRFQRSQSLLEPGALMSARSFGPATGKDDSVKATEQHSAGVVDEQQGSTSQNSHTQFLGKLHSISAEVELLKAESTALNEKLEHSKSLVETALSEMTASHKSTNDELSGAVLRMQYLEGSTQTLREESSKQAVLQKSNFRPALPLHQLVSKVSLALGAQTPQVEVEEKLRTVLVNELSASREAILQWYWAWQKEEGQQVAMEQLEKAQPLFDRYMMNAVMRDSVQWSLQKHVQQAQQAESSEGKLALRVSTVESKRGRNKVDAGVSKAYGSPTTSQETNDGDSIAIPSSASSSPKKRVSWAEETDDNGEKEALARARNAAKSGMALSLARSLQHTGGNPGGNPGGGSAVASAAASAATQVPFLQSVKPAEEFTYKSLNGYQEDQTSNTSMQGSSSGAKALPNPAASADAGVGARMDEPAESLSFAEVHDTIEWLATQVDLHTKRLDAANTAHSKAKEDVTSWMEQFEKLAGRAPSEEDKQRAKHLFSAIEQAEKELSLSRRELTILRAEWLEARSGSKDWLALQAAAQRKELEAATSANAKAKDDLRIWREDFEKMAGRAPSEDDKRKAGHLFSSVEQTERTLASTRRELSDLRAQLLDAHSAYKERLAMQVAAQSQELEAAITANAKAKDDLRNWLEDFEKLAGRAPSEEDKQRAGHLFSAIEQTVKEVYSTRHELSTLRSRWLDADGAWLRAITELHADEAPGAAAESATDSATALDVGTAPLAVQLTSLGDSTDPPMAAASDSVDSAPLQKNLVSSESSRKLSAAADPAAIVSHICHTVAGDSAPQALAAAPKAAIVSHTVASDSVPQQPSVVVDPGTTPHTTSDTTSDTMVDDQQEPLPQVAAMPDISSTAAVDDIKATTALAVAQDSTPPALAVIGQPSAVRGLLAASAGANHSTTVPIVGAPASMPSDTQLGDSKVSSSALAGDSPVPFGRHSTSAIIQKEASNTLPDKDPIESLDSSKEASPEAKDVSNAIDKSKPRAFAAEDKGCGDLEGQKGSIPVLASEIQTDAESLVGSRQSDMQHSVGEIKVTVDAPVDAPSVETVTDASDSKASAPQAAEPMHPMYIDSKTALDHSVEVEQLSLIVTDNAQASANGDGSDKKPHNPSEAIATATEDATNDATTQQKESVFVDPAGKPPQEGDDAPVMIASNGAILKSHPGKPASTSGHSTAETPEETALGGASDPTSSSSLSKRGEGSDIQQPAGEGAVVTVEVSAAKGVRPKERSVDFTSDKKELLLLEEDRLSSRAQSEDISGDGQADDLLSKIAIKKAKVDKLEATKVRLKREIQQWEEQFEARTDRFPMKEDRKAVSHLYLGLKQAEQVLFRTHRQLSELHESMCKIESVPSTLSAKRANSLADNDDYDDDDAAETNKRAPDSPRSDNSYRSQLKSPFQRSLSNISSEEKSMSTRREDNAAKRADAAAAVSGGRGAQREKTESSEIEQDEAPAAVADGDLPSDEIWTKIAVKKAKADKLEVTRENFNREIAQWEKEFVARSGCASTKEDRKVVSHLYVGLKQVDQELARIHRRLSSLHESVYTTGAFAGCFAFDSAITTGAFGFDSSGLSNLSGNEAMREGDEDDDDARIDASPTRAPRANTSALTKEKLVSENGVGMMSQQGVDRSLAQAMGISAEAAVAKVSEQAVDSPSEACLGDSSARAPGTPSEQHAAKALDQVDPLLQQSPVKLSDHTEPVVVKKSEQAVVRDKPGAGQSLDQPSAQALHTFSEQHEAKAPNQAASEVLEQSPVKVLDQAVDKNAEQALDRQSDSQSGERRDTTRSRTASAEVQSDSVRGRSSSTEMMPPSAEEARLGLGVGAAVAGGSAAVAVAAQADGLLSQIAAKKAKVDKMEETKANFKRDIKQWEKDFTAREGRAPTKEDRKAVSHLFVGLKQAEQTLTKSHRRLSNLHESVLTAVSSGKMGANPAVAAIVEADQQDAAKGNEDSREAGADEVAATVSDAITSSPRGGVAAVTTAVAEPDADHATEAAAALLAQVHEVEEAVARCAAAKGAAKKAIKDWAQDFERDNGRAPDIEDKKSVKHLFVALKKSEADLSETEQKFEQLLHTSEAQTDGADEAGQQEGRDRDGNNGEAASGLNRSAEPSQSQAAILDSNMSPQATKDVEAARDKTIENTSAQSTDPPRGQAAAIKDGEQSGFVQEPSVQAADKPPEQQSSVKAPDQPVVDKATEPTVVVAVAAPAEKQSDSQSEEQRDKTRSLATSADIQPDILRGPSSSTEIMQSEKAAAPTEPSGGAAAVGVALGAGAAVAGGSAAVAVAAQADGLLSQIAAKKAKVDKMEETKANFKRDIKQWERDFTAREGRAPTKEDRKAVSHLFVGLKQAEQALTRSHRRLSNLHESVLTAVGNGKMANPVVDVIIEAEQDAADDVSSLSNPPFGDRPASSDITPNITPRLDNAALTSTATGAHAPEAAAALLAQVHEAEETVARCRAAKGSAKKAIKDWAQDYERDNGRAPDTEDKKSVKHLFVALKKSEVDLSAVEQKLEQLLRTLKAQGGRGGGGGGGGGGDGGDETHEAHEFGPERPDPEAEASRAQSKKSPGAVIVPPLQLTSVTADMQGQGVDKEQATAAVAGIPGVIARMGKQEAVLAVMADLAAAEARAKQEIKDWSRVFQQSSGRVPNTEDKKEKAKHLFVALKKATLAKIKAAEKLQQFQSADGGAATAAAASAAAAATASSADKSPGPSPRLDDVLSDVESPLPSPREAFAPPQGASASSSSAKGKLNLDVSNISAASAVGSADELRASEESLRQLKDARSSAKKAVRDWAKDFEATEGRAPTLEDKKVVKNLFAAVKKSEISVEVAEGNLQKLREATEAALGGKGGEGGQGEDGGIGAEASSSIGAGSGVSSIGRGRKNKSVPDSGETPLPSQSMKSPSATAAATATATSVRSPPPAIIVELTAAHSKAKQDIKDWAREFERTTGRAPNKEDKKENKHLFVALKKTMLALEKAEKALGNDKPVFTPGAIDTESDRNANADSDVDLSPRLDSPRQDAKAQPAATSSTISKIPQDKAVGGISPAPGSSTGQETQTEVAQVGAEVGGEVARLTEALAAASGEEYRTKQEIKLWGKDFERRTGRLPGMEDKQSVKPLFVALKKATKSKESAAAALQQANGTQLLAGDKQQGSKDGIANMPLDSPRTQELVAFDTASSGSQKQLGGDGDGDGDEEANKSRGSDNKDSPKAEGRDKERLGRGNVPAAAASNAAVIPGAPPVASHSATVAGLSAALSGATAAYTIAKEEIKEWAKAFERSTGRAPTTEDKKEVKHLFVALKKATQEKELAEQRLEQAQSSSV